MSIHDSVVFSLCLIIGSFAVRIIINAVRYFRRDNDRTDNQRNIDQEPNAKQ